MRQRPTISVSHLGPVERYYALAALTAVWEQKGFRVHIDPAYCADADVCMLHHDRTRLDPDALPTPPNGVRVLNDKVIDISKRAFSTLALREEDEWSGPVIIKTDLNHSGVAERAARQPDAITKIRWRLARLSWRAARMLPERYYPVLDSVESVPSWVWRDPDLIVEKFLPERTGDGLYSVRGWFFLGPKGYAYRVFATDPLVKIGTMVRYEILDAPPNELVTIREQMGVDFGKFDYVEHDGKPILLDVNKTPAYSGAGVSPRLQMLAEGIEAFL